MQPHRRPGAPGSNEEGARQTDSAPTPASLARQVASTIRSEPLAAVLAQHVRDLADYEASVRGGTALPIRAGRMMVERASSDVLHAIASALDAPLPAVTSRWLELARENQLPIIVGWDLRSGGGERCVKIYLNASDAAASVRARLCEMLAPGCDVSPAVLGMNARADGVVETKLYVQSADAVALAADLDQSARALAAAAHAEHADAGGVLSFDAGASLQARAFFVALREPGAQVNWTCVRSLPGYNEASIESLLPFPPASPRSVGVSLSDSSWTLYYKPRRSGRAPEALEPLAIFRDGGAEVGVFVEPTEHAARAFRRTARHAISVRIRSGAPTPTALESLVDWFAERVQDVEQTDTPLHMPVNDPPAPWHTVDRARETS